MLRGQGQQRTDGAVDVEPEPFACAERGQRIQVVGRARVDGRGVANDTEGLSRLRPGPLPPWPRSASTSISKRSLTGTLRSERAPSPSDSIAFCTQLCTSTDAYVTSGRGIAATPSARTSTPARALRATASPTKFAIEPPLTSRPLDLARQTGDVLAPVDDLRLDVVGHVIATAHVGIEHGREEIADGGERRAVAHEPRPEARVGVAHGVRQHQLLEFRVRRRGTLRLTRGGSCSRASTHSGTGCQTGRSPALCR